MAERSISISSGSAVVRKRRRFLVDVLIRLVKEKPLGTVGAGIVLLLLIAGIFAQWLAPYNYDTIWVGGKLDPPNAAHWMGTDNVGRDVLSRVIHGARVSMFVGLGVSALATFLNTVIGLTSGFLGGKADLVIQRFVDAWMCFPGLFLMLTFMALVGSGLIQVIIVLGVLYGISGSRTIRSAVIGIKQNIYVDAAKSTGCPTRSILLKHILPNVTAPIIIVFTTITGAAIIAEASISFLGYGIPPPTPSWGGMLSGSGRQYMLQSPWLALWPGLALSVVVYGINMFGDALRDLLDPRLRGGLGRYSGVKAKQPKTTRHRK